MKKTQKYLDGKNLDYVVSADGLITVQDNLTVGSDITLECVEKITGSVYVQQGATFTAPALAKSGSVDVQQGATFTAPALAEVSGYVYVQQGATFTAPALAKSGYVYVQQGATFTAPALAKSGSVDVQQGATFTAPALAEVSGYVYVQQGATFTAPALAEVSGSVDVQQGATFTAPALAKSGYVYVQQGATFTAPALAEVSGSVYVQQGATFTAPALANIDHLLYEGEFLGEQITVIDEIGCVVISSKSKNGIAIKQCRKSTFKDGKLCGDKFFVASKDGHNAHATTIQAAILELEFKVGSRDISEFRNLPLTTKKSPQEWAMVYRMVTGACQYGVRSFIESKGELKKTYTLKEIAEQTRGAYGSDKFKQVVLGGAV